MDSQELKEQFETIIGKAAAFDFVKDAVLSDVNKIYTNGGVTMTEACVKAIRQMSKNLHNRDVEVKHYHETIRNRNETITKLETDIKVLRAEVAELQATDPIPANSTIRRQAEDWHKVQTALSVIYPGWGQVSMTPADAAVLAIQQINKNYNTAMEQATYRFQEMQRKDDCIKTLEIRLESAAASANKAINAVVRIKQDIRSIGNTEYLK